jgi:hypothetical protein
MKKDKKKRKKDRGGAALTAVARARAAVTRTTQKLDDRLATLERVADALEEAAIERFRTAAVIALRDEQLVRDLADLQAAFATRAPGGLPADLEPFRHLPEAVLTWMRERFGLAPHLETGRVLQMPSEKLDGFTLAGDHGDPLPGVLVRVRVLAPGWMRGNEVVIPPRVALVQ